MLQTCFSKMTRITEGIHDGDIIDAKRRMRRQKGSGDGALNVIEKGPSGLKPASFLVVAWARGKFKKRVRRTA